jgi:cysteine desulfurase
MGVYLDYFATSPIHPEVLDEMVTVYKTNFGNAASRTHSYGSRANKAVEEARRHVAFLLGVSPQEVIFTSGATESNNLAIIGLAAWGKTHGREHIVSTQIEHKSVLEPLNYLRDNGFDVEFVAPDRSGRVRASDVLSRVRDDTLLVSVMHANNETGTIQPVGDIGSSLSKTNTFFHIDAAQTCCKLVDEIRVIQHDLMSVTAHKMYGPQGVGALIVRRRSRGQRPPIQPIMHGGGHERGLRPGTLPVALVCGFGKACELAAAHYRTWQEHSRRIKDEVLSQLQSIPHVINGCPSHSLDNCVNVSIKGLDSEAIMLAVGDRLAISNGAACTSSVYRASHVLTAMGLETELIEGALRISWGLGVESVDLSPLVEVVRTWTNKDTAAS